MSLLIEREAQVLRAVAGHLSGSPGARRVVTWLTGMPARSRWLSLGMLVLFGLQYNVRALATLLHAPYLIPLHAVNALALFWIASTLAGWARQNMRRARVTGSFRGAPTETTLGGTQ